MKQITFSNIVAVAALLLCFYAFREGKPENSPSVTKEYCILSAMYDDIRLVFNVSVSGEESHTERIVESAGLTQQKLICEKITSLSAEGWVLKSQSSTSEIFQMKSRTAIGGYETNPKYATTHQYVFERNK